MRYDRNSNPEWGYLTSVPRVMRMARLIAVAAIIGATAGAAMVFSLLDRPVADESVAARTLVAPELERPVTTSTSLAAQQPTGPQQINGPAGAQNSQEQKVTPGATGTTVSTRQRPALADAPAVKEPPFVQTSNDTAAIAPDPAPVSKAQSKKPRITARSPYVARKFDRYFDGPRYGYDPRYGYQPGYGSRGSFAWEQY